MSDETPEPFLKWSCVSCTRQAETPLKNPGIQHLDAPEGWVRLGVVTRDGGPHGFRWLCDDCAGFIRRELPNALGLDEETKTDDFDPSGPFCTLCEGPYMHLMDETGGHWDTCPNRAKRDPACVCPMWKGQRVYPGTDGFKHHERCPVAEGNQ